MMTITALGQTVKFDEKHILFAEGRELEKLTGTSGLAEVFEHVAALNSSAIQALVYVALRRHNPSINFSDLDNEDLFGSIQEDKPADAATDDEGADDGDPLDGSVDELEPALTSL